MKYLVLLAHPGNGWSDADDEQRAAWHQDHVAFHRTVGANILGGEALAGIDTATTIRRTDGRVVLSDGPFAETAEIIGGFYLLEAADLDQVTRWCELLPELYTIEIRPCVEVDGMDG